MQTILDCPICEKVVYSEIGKGCKMCGMHLESNDQDFCCRLCMRKYNKINKKIKWKKIY